MTYPRNEVVAVLAGVTCRAGAVRPDGTVRLSRKGPTPPNDPRFSYDEKWDLWETVVPVDACDLLVEINSFARYRGAPCQVMSIGDDGRALVYYTGDNGAEAEKNGFEQTDPGTYSTIVPVGELFDYHEIHRDLLFERWRARSFGEAVHR
ncbi:MAG TPA: hypothetical protein VFV67_21710 [Actinophytocola sp.]|uniref:hypothetical protein n=1 Tax=Actinophytocola sp. TaxID=1872138 RepID=UPI002DB94CA8|nr:hypothetical protein [Actinophytocola sp.]HEU5473270.1 hypothetical protein [Actinophytocola sp.]